MELEKSSPSPRPSPPGEGEPFPASKIKSPPSWLPGIGFVVSGCVPGIIAFLFASVASSVATPSAEEVEFFESKVRPIFVEHCYSCHSDKAEKLKGGLKLDSSDALLKGGTSGAAIVPGQPDASLLIKAVRYGDPDLQMPPKNKKLSNEQIAMLETWVRMGAPMPAGLAVSRGLDISKVRAKHWAFQPVSKPKVPAVKNARWVQTPVDNFVLAKLEANKIKPAPAADRRTLIRRLSFDLTGLPPACDEVEAFVHDKDPQAYSKLVDRLLASPHYGERWGRYWLDVARYADTRGYLVGGEERRYPFSYTYRDYVVRAFNEDKPYDQFLIEQIAGDRLATGEDKRAQAALGFLTLGRRFLNNQNDIIDDRIDVVTRGTMGLTVACARCHDHKFDPISTKDYYALHGVFASSHEPAELPLLGAIVDSTNHQDYLKQKAKIETEIEELRKGEIAKFTAELRQHAGDYLLGAADAGRLEDSAKFETFAGERKLNPTVLRRWMKYLEEKRKASGAVFRSWFETEARTAVPGSAGVSPASIKTNELAGETPALPAETNSLKGAAEAYSKLFKEVEADWKAGMELAKKESKPAPVCLPDPQREAVRQVLYAADGPLSLSKDEIEIVLGRKLREGAAPLRNKIEALNWTHSGAPPRAMALVDREQPENSHVLLRGNPGNPGEEVPRRFPELLNPAGQAFTNGSGRLELARAIANRTNALTARVYVNRICLHHFGEGLVSTAGDFGVRTEEPTHRALLDYLAAEFMEHGWSTKYLHRIIVLSATYQQGSDPAAESVRTDPENRLFSRMNRQRLDFEAMRDTILDLAGTLDLTVGGLPVDILAEPFSNRRTIYGFIDRQNLPGLFRTFDFANPDTSSQGRFHTTVPQQALFLMNSPFILEQADKLAKRSQTDASAGDRQKIVMLYKVALQRAPSDPEIRRAERFLTRQPATGKISGMAKLAQVLLLSNETMFVD